MAMWRRQLRTAITDPELRARCVPDYVMGCKRVLFSNDWYPTLDRPNVELVTERIERIVPDGVVTTDGTDPPRRRGHLRHRLRQATQFLTPMQVSGRGGRSAAARPGGTGRRPTSRITVAGFPNFFMLYGPEHQPRRQLDHQHARRPDQLRPRRPAGPARPPPGLGRRAPRRAGTRSTTGSQSAQPLLGVGASGCHSWYTRVRAQYQQLARPHVPVPPPGPPLRPGRLPRHARPKPAPAGHEAAAPVSPGAAPASPGTAPASPVRPRPVPVPHDRPPRPPHPHGCRTCRPPSCAWAPRQLGRRCTGPGPALAGAAQPPRPAHPDLAAAARHHDHPSRPSPGCAPR